MGGGGGHELHLTDASVAMSFEEFSGWFREMCVSIHKYRNYRARLKLGGDIDSETGVGPMGHEQELKESTE